MKSIIICKNSHCHNHVRVKKFLEYFTAENYEINYLCWLRSPEQRDPKNLETYILRGGGFGGIKLAFFYPIWCINLFIHLFLSSFKNKNLALAIDFDSALPAYFVSKLRPGFKYVYDIHDDFALRYKFPLFIKKLISKLDLIIKNNSICTIHVDESRIRNGEENSTVIYNTPKDFYKNNYPSARKVDFKKFAVSGLLCEQRGLPSLAKFANAHPDFRFIVAGSAIDDCSKKFTELKNVDFLGYISQDELFKKISDAAFIFSLYDPSIEINRLAASNKLYDSMMLGIPVVVNSGILAAELVNQKNIGFVVSFDYDNTWDILANSSNDEIITKGKNGRILYEEEYSFESNFIKKLNQIFNKI